ncbi:MAG TPA: class I SAM-dependent methyltransferase [Arthrobacter sp.]|jgi:SAM-dependent methyltransferase|nr:class I SAM-dependent methyltransferase [Arthrobacter sp.]
MGRFDPAQSFDADVAARYDDALRGDEADAVNFLADLVDDGGSALEFAVGTGRIALPLAERGVRVHGIELSRPMIDRLKSKPGGDAVEVTAGDMSTAGTGARYPLVYLVFNTIFNLQTQDDQVRCFQNAARHLTPDGAFVIETAVPSAWLPTHSYVRPEKMEARALTFDVCSYDPVTQILDENHVRISDDGTVRFAPISCRLAWPAELDLMARIAGLRLAARWGGWKGEPYNGRDMHVSVYRPLGADVVA